MKNNVTIIICTKNAEATIKHVLDTVKDYKVILVDCSNDNTRVIARDYPNVKVVIDKGKGLAAARNLGLKHVKMKHVMMLGSDNIMPKEQPSISGIWFLPEIDFIQEAIEYMKYKQWVGVGLLTDVLAVNTMPNIGNLEYWYKPRNYLAKCMSMWWRSKFYEGEREVIGTACIYETKVLKWIKYDDRMAHSDDSDLGARLKVAGYKQGYSPYHSYDISEVNLDTLKDKFTRYGLSDKMYYKKFSQNWGLIRKIKSWLHPLRTEWIGFKLYYLPFYFLIVYIRYKGWLKK